MQSATAPGTFKGYVDTVRSMSDRPKPIAATLDREAFARHYAEVYPRLLLVGYAMLGNRAAAEDAVQQAATTALTKIKDFTPGTHFGAWMTQFVRHTALNDRRRANTRRASNIDDVQVTAPTVANAHEANHAVDGVGQLHEDRGHFDDELRQGLLALAPIARACLLLRTVAELDYKEIAETLGLPAGTAMSHVYRARQQLRQQLSAAPTPEASP